MAAAGGAAAGTAAFLVLEAAKPWSRQTHKLFPAPARARAVELMLVGELLSREERFAAYGPQAVVDAWMTFVVPQAVVRSRGRELLRESAIVCAELQQQRDELQRRIDQLTKLQEEVEAAGEEMPDARSAASDLAPALAEMQGLAAALAKIQLP